MKDWFSKKHGDEREEIHKNKATYNSTRFVPNANERGLRGEFEFASQFNVSPNLTKMVNGDGGFDFRVPFIFTVDVKTRTKEFKDYDPDLLVEENKVNADIFVLAVLSKDEKDCNLVGWQTAAYVKSRPTKDLGRGKVNHIVKQTELRPMEELYERRIKW